MEEIEIAYKKFDEGDFEGAISVFNTYLDKVPSDLEALFKRAIAYRKIDDFENSLHDFETLTNLQPKSADLISERGIAKYFCDNLKGALEDFDKCIELEPLNPYRYSSRAYIKGQSKDIEGAISDYEKTLELDPNDVTALNNLGLLEEQRGRGANAKKHFEKSDNIMGIKKRSPEDYKDIETSSKPKIKKEESVVENPLPNQKVTSQSFFKTLSDIFTNKEVRNEFLDFIRGKKKQD